MLLNTILLYTIHTIPYILYYFICILYILYTILGWYANMDVQMWPWYGTVSALIWFITPTCRNIDP